MIACGMVVPRRLIWRMLFLAISMPFVTRLMWTTRSINSRPWASRSFSRSRGARGPPPRLLLIRFPSCLWSPSEFQSALAGGVSECPDLAVVDVPAAIENDSRNALLFCPGGDELTDFLGSLHIRSRLALLLQCLVERGRKRDRVAGGVVDHLSV